MRFDKKILNNMSKKYATLALGAASLIMGCGKDDPKDLMEQHDTTYTFAPLWYDHLDNLDQIRRSADSVQVRHIYFRCTDGDEYAWDGINLTSPLKHLKPAFDAAQGKGRSAGEFNKCLYVPINVEAAAELTDRYGYIVNFMTSTQENQR